MKKLMAFFKDEEGATAVEYGLMVGLIAVMIMGAVSVLGTNMSEAFSDVASVVGTSGGS